MGLAEKTCVRGRGGVPGLGAAEAERLLAETPGWTLEEGATRIRRIFRFRNFAEAIFKGDEIPVTRAVTSRTWAEPFASGRAKPDQLPASARFSLTEPVRLPATVGKPKARATCIRRSSLLSPAIAIRYWSSVRAYRGSPTIRPRTSRRSPVTVSTSRES